MTRILFVERGGARHQVDAQDGASAMEAAVRNGVPGIPAECGGACACGTCHVHVDADWATKIPAAEEIEMELLAQAEGRGEGSRLSCQIVITPALEGLVLNLADSK